MARSGQARPRSADQRHSRHRPCFILFSCGTLSQSRFRCGCCTPEIGEYHQSRRNNRARLSQPAFRQRNCGRHQAARHSALAEVTPRQQQSCLDDDLEDAGIMRRIYKIGILHEHVAKNPVLYVETRSKTDYKAIVITPAQTLAILKVVPSPLHFALVLTCAATALRASEMLRYAGRTYCGMKEGFGFQNGGRRARAARLKRRHRTDMFHCTRFCPPICAHGENKAPMPKTETSCSRL
jgi:hypothetical protein